ncbi:hypothetical protein BZG20_13180 [Salinivibrio sp. IB868]|uniref:hypothetical protein n=1 Tax=unclassified Salinivibrio TaxID=2636825 RepID=UPI0009868513|nr:MULTISPECIES: hypothetical protein [unclassified Salinivibrio]OOE65060.1 hypothetical protein BZG20_13180 [Salinivibrio sp. IB868]OOE75084.1 hypothetical protein BZG22_06800 [Salinivibrio sp. IB870]
MKIITGEVSQVHTSSYQQSEGSENNKRQVTYQVQKFLLHDKLYIFKRPGSAMNINNGNTITIAVGLGKNVNRLYNVTTGEYSHKSPHSFLVLILTMVIAAIGIWNFSLKDLVVNFSPEYTNYAYILFSIVICFQFFLYAREYILYKKLKEK